MTEEEKEQRIQQHMTYANMTRSRAEFVVAMEAGEIDGDVIDQEQEDAGE